MNSFYVMLSSFYFKSSLISSLKVPIYRAFESTFSVWLMSKKVKNGLKGGFYG